MKPRQRTLFGTAFAVVLVPLIIGLAGCLPVPIGDPERSRLDPDLTGIWVGFDRGVTYFEPWDKRTWLVTSVDIETPAGCMPAGTEGDYDAFVAWLGKQQCASADRAAVFKAWRSKHGGRWFLTMEPMVVVDDEADDPFADGIWFVYRIDKTGAGAFTLQMVDPEFDGFEGLPQTRRAYERVIRRHASNDAMYVGGAQPFDRVRDEHIKLLVDFVERMISIE